MNVERRLNELSTLNRILEVLNRQADFSKALQQALEELVKLLKLSSGWVFLSHAESDAKQSALPLAAFVGLPPALQKRDCKALREGSCNCQWYFRRGQLDKGVNIVDCSRLELAKGNKGGLEVHASMPLLTDEGPVGILNLASPGREVFDEETLAFLTAVGRALGLAFRRSRLQENYIKEREAIAKLEERTKLARDIQHSVSELLSAATSSLQTAQGNKTVTTLVTSSLAELNTLGELLEPSVLQNLTPKETEVLRLIAKGLTNKAIAKTLNIAEKTVKTHVSSILSKLNLKTRTAAALWAKERGL
jgi:DNA-binding CsgD family transcriptional regulator/putative methionine-R-sulfoxide reductase with GAF domain